jgi:tripartite-type tricarboxylate transporter receptor subunit TctC
MHRQRLRGCAVLALAALSFPAGAQVRDFPAKPLRIIVPTAPGGIVDLVTRIPRTAVD